MCNLVTFVANTSYCTFEDRTTEMLGENIQIDLTRLYLARFNEDGEWYRAAPRSAVDPDGKVF